LATKAVAGNPKEADFRGTLGTARYRAGDWKAAIADMEQAISLRKPDDSENAHDGFFLGMAHWQLGEKEKSKEWFARAVAWMDKSKKYDPELKRFRAEAAELLGVKEKK
jgi:tetratricopeptide (TPR) repeat protein